MTIYYTGNEHGAVSFVADVVGNKNVEQSAHYCVPHTVRKFKSREELEYLRFKGVFSVPPEEVCNALIRTYFLHVHPVLPVLDATTFLTTFTQDGYSNINLLLLWSIFSVAASFVDPSELQSWGYASRKALKRTAYQRAKVLYDNAYDDDQLSLIQSVILMGHWHADAEDRFEAWHWTGIAISLCQTAGLHCSPARSAKKSVVLTEPRERLCRRIWWTCVYRDRWLSFVKGRPLRIRLEDGNLAQAAPEDMECDLRQLPETIKRRYTPYDPMRISQFWCKIVETSILLGDVLTLTTRMQNRFPQPTEGDIVRCDWKDEEFDSLNVYEQICAYHIRLLYYATSIAFWRARMGRSSDVVYDNSRQQEATAKSRAAAMKSNGILEQMMTKDLLKYMKSQTISALVPPMQIHLLDSSSTISSVRLLGSNRLQLCMGVLEELKETYWAAEFVLKLFERAIERITRRHHRASHSLSYHQFPSTMHDSGSTHKPSDGQPTPESISSIDDLLIPGFGFDNSAGMDLFWSGSAIGESSELNAFLANEDFFG